MTNNFDNIPIYTGAANDEQNNANRMAMTPAVTSGNNAMTTIEQSRAVAEIQAAMVVAKSCPRDEFNAYNRIMKACKRKSLAEQAMYAYKRGGTLIEGASIRFAELLARHWGNITYGLREIDRRSGVSEMEAFAHDLETNTKVSRQFIVRHIRETRAGNKDLGNSDRDVYELTTNMGQRRVRACLLELIPGDIVEAALDKCKETIAKGDGRPTEDRARDMVVAFDALGVTLEMIERFLGHKLSAIVPAQLVQLSKIYTSIRDGVAPKEEYFKYQSDTAVKQEAVDPWAESCWKNIRAGDGATTGLAAYFKQHEGTFNKQPSAIQKAFRAKWQRLYPNLPFPTEQTDTPNEQSEEQPEKKNTQNQDIVYNQFYDAISQKTTVFAINNFLEENKDTINAVLDEEHLRMLKTHVEECCKTIEEITRREIAEEKETI